MKKLLLGLALLGISIPVHADEAQNFSREYNRVFAQFLREKIEKVPKGALIRLYLKDGTTVNGVFDGFHPYDDSVWMNIGKFFDDAYDIRNLEDVRVRRLHD